MKIVNELDNKLLNRKEISIRAEYDVNPGFEKVTKELAEKFKTTEDLIVVRSVKGNFGSHEFFIDAFIYDNTESKATLAFGKKKEAKK